MKVKQFIGGVAAFVMAALCAQGAQAQVGPWTGLYLGVNAGYGWTSDSSPSSDGFLGGIHAGYNWQFGSALLGVEGDSTFSGMESGAAVAAAGAVVDVDSLWSLRARLGFTPVNNVLLFGTVGYGGFEVRRMGAIGGNFDDRMTGLVAGGGLEYMVSSNILARVESLWYLGNGDGAGDADVGTVRLGLSYRF